MRARLLPVALDARHPLVTHAQVRLPQESVQHHHGQQEEPELNEERAVQIDELRLVRLGRRNENEWKEREVAKTY